MMKARITSGWILIICSLLSMWVGRPHVAWGATKQVVTAERVAQAPAGLDDVVWQNVKAINVPFEGKEKLAKKTVSVNTQSVYTKDQIYFLFSWPDATQSVTKGAWRFDGQTWEHMKGNEDRIAVLFEISRINQFATKGCTAVCHGVAGTPTKEWKFATKTEDEKGDLWHWKAARSAPYQYADDGWLTIAGKKTGRHNDAGKGGDMKNQTEDKSKPRYMQAPATTPSVPGFLLSEETAEIAQLAQFKTGDMIPYRLPKAPKGSRADVQAISRHADGYWTVMLSRQLDTGQEDDLSFNVRKKYSFAMAVFDDSGDEHSYDSEVLTLQFGR